MIFRAYYPKPLFPPISLSDGCMLMCRHCMGKYLHGMIKITETAQLIDFCRDFEKKGGKGILVSGGSDKEGRIIGLKQSINALKKIRKETDLVIAVHAGYVDENTANELADACDIAFVDVIGDDGTARQVIGLESADKYIESIKNLISAGIPITPHITIGLYYGKIKGEYAAIDAIKKFNIKKIVLNVILPTPDTDFENIALPPLKEIEFVIKKGMGAGEVALGCMRPRGMREIEKIAIENGIKDIALPSKEGIAYAGKKGYAIKEVPACCGLTDDLIRKITE